jgi:hypothetical protein
MSNWGRSFGNEFLFLPVARLYPRLTPRIASAYPSCAVVTAITTALPSSK